MPITLDGSNGITTPTYGGADTAEYIVPVTAFKNRIINSGMQIDQRNAGASVTVPVTTTLFTIDRWKTEASSASRMSIQRSTVAPAGFTNSMLVTSLSAFSLGAGDYFDVFQPIEGFNVADLGWGTANAATVTLSFWTRSSLTGTFGGSVKNNDANRSYPFTYTISAANTWEYKTITIAGDTTGTWFKDNQVGLVVLFSLGMGSNFSGTANSWQAGNIASATGATSVVGTNGATFYITGVQLEVGSTATSFDYRPYGTELALCQRYYQVYTQPSLRGVISGASALARAGMVLPVVMRAAPTAVVGALPVFDGGNVGTFTTLIGAYISSSQVEFDYNLSNSGFTAGRAGVVYQGGSASLTLSAEL